MPKKEKHVYMECPDCNAAFEKEPLLMISEKTGDSHMTFVLLKKCKYCGCNLVRRVEKK